MKRMIDRHRRLIAAFALAVSLTACVGDGDIYPVPVFPGGGGGGGGGTVPARPAPPPAKPIVPPVVSSETEEPDPSGEQVGERSDEQPSEVVVYEQHGATSLSQCQQMAQRFKREGRDVRLVKVVPNSFNKGGGALRYICLFDGPDKVVEGNVFEDYRYNSPDEYNSP